MDFDVRKLDDPDKYERLVELAPAIWWDPAGPLGGLHLLNEVRVPYFEQVLGGFAGKRILDVGCGGGIFSEALARGGASVVAFDASPRSLEAAIAHARESGLEIDYRHALAESFEPGEQFDAVMAVDVLEHVADVDAALDTCARALRPGGVFGFLTHNQTLRAFEELVWIGEYQLGFIPKGNHDFHKFLTPEDLGTRMAERGLRPVEMRGVAFDLDVPRAMLSESTEVSFLGHAIRQ
ncbi:MAG: 2-polyprenyl-6-hydroxyphenyl methylase / 3-demethylubiquinone-9 3-methyltransferase [Miltoncostaeaceae bacterium]|nr:2-polyprenyl-6-hydroxyphenyl methylase / 3-demethylubiquinone-9 3-methyltransferase [Miltoncostaeaceae bacterium]